MGDFVKSIRESMLKNKLMGISVGMLSTIFLIIAADIAMSPFYVTRYQLDITFLISIQTFIVIGALYNCKAGRKRRLNSIMVVFAAIPILAAVLLFFVQFDSNLAEYYPELLEHIRAVID